MEKTMKLFVVVGACAAFGAASALAIASENQGIYIGAGAGQLKAEGFDGSTTGYKAFVGANFNRYLALEGGYIGSREVSGGFYDPNTGLLETATGSVSAAELSLLAKVPLGQSFSLYGRAGGLYWREDVSGVSSDYYGDVVGFSGSETGGAFAWGGGAEATFGHFAVRAEYEQANINSVRYQLITGSLIYRF